MLTHRKLANGATVPVCKCHGEPCCWHSDPRRQRGGYWRCPVKDRDEQRDRYQTNEMYRLDKLGQQRDRYNADPVHRISKNLHDHARRRAQTLARKREALSGEVSL